MKRVIATVLFFPLALVWAIGHAIRQPSFAALEKLVRWGDLA